MNYVPLWGKRNIIVKSITTMMTRFFTIAVIIAAVVTTIIVTGNETFTISHAQLLTLKQKAAFCNPDNPKLKFVNSTESKICGIPASPQNQTNATPPTPSSILSPSVTKVAP
jgi:hypothetical protein